MKKTFLIFLLSLLILLSGISCAGTEPETEPEEQPGQTEQPQADYDDGVYSLEDEFDDRGWKPIVTVVVEGEKITKAYYDEINEENQLKGFDQEYLERWKESSGENLMTAGPELADVLIQQQDPDKVDTVSGATSTSEKFKQLISDALEQSPQSKKEAGYYDGLQKAEGEYDERGWKPFVAVIVEDGRITDAYYDEVNDGTRKFKSYDDEYNANWKESSGSNLQLARPQLVQELINEQNTDEIDTVTGATSTSGKFKELIEEALAPFEG